MQRFDIINSFIQRNGYTSYLEIGVSNGDTFQKINIQHKESVDPAIGRYNTSKPTYKMTSDEFFEKHPDKKFDIVFIDGLHHSDQVDKDIDNSLKSLNDGGVIVLHDCNPTSKEEQVIPRETTRWLGDVWKSFVTFKENNKSKYQCFVIDTDCGCGIIRNGKTDTSVNIPNELTYEWLNKNRKKALNLISIEEFKSIL